MPKMGGDGRQNIKHRLLAYLGFAARLDGGNTVFKHEPDFACRSRQCCPALAESHQAGVEQRPRSAADGGAGVLLRTGF